MGCPTLTDELDDIRPSALTIFIPLGGTLDEIAQKINREVNIATQGLKLFSANTAFAMTHGKSTDRAAWTRLYFHSDPARFDENGHPKLGLPSHDEPMPPPKNLMGLNLIAEERMRQLLKEKFSAEHDDAHTKGELAEAAAAYTMAASRVQRAIRWGTVDGPAWAAKVYKDQPEKRSQVDEHIASAAADPLNYEYSRKQDGSVDVPQHTPYWPFEVSWWKPDNDPIKTLTKAGALIAAELDRLLRLKATADSASTQGSPK